MIQLLGVNDSEWLSQIIDAERGNSLGDRAMSHNKESQARYVVPLW